MGLALLFGSTIFMFAWWQAGSMAAARPWLRGQRLIIEPTHISFEKFGKGTQIERTINVTNLSTVSQTIFGSQRSCGCLSVDEFPFELAAGDKRKLTLRMQVSDHAGEFEYTVKFFTSEQDHSPTVVAVTGLVE